LVPTSPRRAGRGRRRGPARDGDVGTKAANGENVFEVRNTPNLAALRDPQQRARDHRPAGGIVRFNWNAADRTLSRV